MSNTETPAGNASGPSPTSTQDSGSGTFELPAKLRVHALAKLLGSSSREVITSLEQLGEPVRSAQSNITREVALQVVRALQPEQLVEDAPAAERSAAPAEPAQAEPAAPAESAAARNPVFAAPAAMPDRSGGTAFITVVVTGTTVMPMPMPASARAGTSSA